jgi:hypothetical protein
MTAAFIKSLLRRTKPTARLLSMAQLLHLREFRVMRLSIFKHHETKVPS